MNYNKIPLMPTIVGDHDSELEELEVVGLYDSIFYERFFVLHGFAPTEEG
jgi:hypothetical protein